MTTKKTALELEAEEAENNIGRLLGMLQMFYSARMPEMVQTLAQDLAQGRSTTIDEVEAEITEWAQKNPNEAVTILLMLNQSEFEGPDWFKRAAYVPSTRAEKWLYAIRQGTPTCQPVVTMLACFLLVGLERHLNPERNVKTSEPAKRKLPPPHSH